MASVFALSAPASSASAAGESLRSVDQVDAAAGGVGHRERVPAALYPVAPQLLGAGSCQVAEFADIGRRHYNDFLILVAGLRQGPLDGGIVARAAQDLDADIAGERRAGAEQTDIVPPIVPVTAGDCRYRLGLIDRSEQRSPYRRVVERRIAVVKGHDAVRRREMRDHGDVGVAADLVDEIARRVLPPVPCGSQPRYSGTSFSGAAPRSTRARRAADPSGSTIVIAEQMTRRRR
jgi:hypothetical protein